MRASGSRVVEITKSHHEVHEEPLVEKDFVRVVPCCFVVKPPQEAVFTRGHSASISSSVASGQRLRGGLPINVIAPLLKCGLQVAAL